MISRRGDRKMTPRQTKNPQRLAMTSVSCAGLMIILDATPVAAANHVLATTSGNATSGAGLLLAMSAGVVILGVGGFSALTWSRRKRAPQPCASQREALAVAEQAVRYWEGALTHLRTSAQGDAPAMAGPSGESHASLFEKATAGHANALQVRDERQLDLIRCMTLHTGKDAARDDVGARLEPLTFESDPRSTPPTP